MNRAIRVGLIAEGKAEQGLSMTNIKPQDGGEVIKRSHEGALHTLIRRELKKAGYDRCEFIQRHPNRKESLSGRANSGYLAITNRKYIAQVVSNWQQDEVDIIVLVVDGDEEQEQRFTKLNESLMVVRQNHFIGDKLQPSNHVGGLAIKSFDTWLLADTQQIERFLGVSLPSDLPQNLEELSGNSHLPDCSKNIFDNAVKNSTYTPKNIAGTKRRIVARWELAFNVDLAKIKERCPDGYRPFAISLCEVVQTIIETRPNNI